MSKRYDEPLSEDRTRCLLCPRRCELAPGALGFCKARRNVDGAVLPAAPCCTSGIAVDPIEKKPLYQFLPGSRVLSFGTFGCNMGCLFCQNWSISKTSAGESPRRQEAEPDRKPKKEPSQSENHAAFYRTKQQKSEEAKRRAAIKRAEDAIAAADLRLAEIASLMAEPETAADYVRMSELCAEMEELKKSEAAWMDEWAAWMEEDE